MKISAFLVAAIGLVAVIVGLSLLLAFPIMWLINYTFTTSVLLALFGVPQITFWKTVVLSVVTSWLFKGGSSSSSSK